MNFIKACTSLLQNNSIKAKIAFVEGHSKRMIAAASYLKENNILEPVMILETYEQFEEVKDQLKDLKYYIISKEATLYDKLAHLYALKRKDKETKEKAFASVKLAQFFACLLVEEGLVDGAIGGVRLSTADILRAAFKVVGPKPNVKTISSIMILSKEKQTYIFGDISVNPSPKLKQLVDIGINATNFVKESNQLLKGIFHIEEKVAFLSFSTAGSGINESSKMVAEATKEFNSLHLSKELAIGEVQFDTALLEKVREQKYPHKSFSGESKIFIFPDLNSGNIGYKIAQR